MNQFTSSLNIPQYPVRTHVYFIYNPDTGYIKIGVSEHPAKRLRELQTGNSAKLEILSTVECVSGEHAYSVERALHTLYADRSVSGEWFNVTREQIEDMLLVVERMNAAIAPEQPDAQPLEASQAYKREISITMDLALREHFKRFPDYIRITRSETIEHWLNATAAAIDENKLMAEAMMEVSDILASGDELAIVRAQDVINRVSLAVRSIVDARIGSLFSFYDDAPQSDALKQEAS
jgi:hypothetical protein